MSYEILLGFVVPNPAWSPCKDACSHPKMHSWRDFSCCVGWKIEGRKERELRLAFERSALEVKLARQNNQNCVTYFPISSPRGVAAAVAAAAYGPATTQMPGFARPCSPLKGKAAATRSWQQPIVTIHVPTYLSRVYAYICIYIYIYIFICIFMYLLIHIYM